LEAAIQSARQGMGQRGLAHARHTLNQQMAARQHGHHGQAQSIVIATDDGA